MTKRMIAVLPLVCLLMVALGGSESVPTAAASSTPSMTAPAAPNFSAPTDPGWGACRWYCGSKSYATAAQCDANCSFECEVIC